jgi:hypothetical protein
VKNFNKITAEINIIPNLSENRYWLLNDSIHKEINSIWLSLEYYSMRKEIKEDFENYEIFIKNDNRIKWILKDNIVIRKNEAVIEIKEDCNKKMINALLNSMPNKMLRKVKPFIINNLIECKNRI